MRAGSDKAIAATAMPTNVAFFPRSVDSKAQAAVTEFGNFEGTGELSRAFAPFVPGAGADWQQDMRLNLPEELSAIRSAVVFVFVVLGRGGSGNQPDAKRAKYGEEG